MQLEQIHSYKYSESIINRDKSIEEEIRERIMAGNKAYYANRSILNSKLVHKKSKLLPCWCLHLVVVGEL
jgi:hypothetical protein